MDTPNSFVIRHKQSDPAVEKRDLDGIVSQDQLEVIVLHWIAAFLVSINPYLPLALPEKVEPGLNMKAGFYCIKY